MGRGRVELKRIENKINRQVTFAKRRNGLLKKAYELSVLCDAEVALIIFSNRGKLYEFCSSLSMVKTIERYQQCSYTALEASRPPCDSQNNYQQEYLKLKGKVEALQRTQRNLLGEDLAPLNTKELEQLEHQLEISLKQIRSTKTQYMLDQLADLQLKEQSLLETNKALKKKLEADNMERIQYPQPWEDGGHNIPYLRLATHSEAFYQPIGINPTMQLGYNHHVGSNEVGDANQPETISGFMPGWFL
ncbi:hypothetical protein QQ045_021354 [Rhodiola kirilowii]